VLDTTPDGEFVLFRSAASNLVGQDADIGGDVFLWRRSTDTTELVSVDSAEDHPTAGDCSDGAVSDDGRFVAFTCLDKPIVPEALGVFRRIFLRDRTGGTTKAVDRVDGAAGALGNGNAWNPEISGDGTLVLFDSDATNLLGAGGDTNATRDVFARVLATNDTQIVSLADNEAQGSLEAGLARASTTGRYVAFRAVTPTLAPGDANGPNGYDIFVRDRTAGTTERISVSSSETGANADAIARPAITGDGRYVAFSSAATNLDPRDAASNTDVFLRDRTGGTTELISLSTTGTGGNGESDNPSVSADGRWVAFATLATNLVAGDTATFDVVLRDRGRSTTTRLSQTPFGVAGNAASTDAFVSGDGQRVAFTSAATNLVTGPETGKQILQWSSDRYSLFSDVPATQLFWDEIHWAVTNSFVEGYSDGTFRPAAPVSRQAMVAFLHRLRGSPPGPYPVTGFTDVPGDSPFRIAIEWAVSEGIVDGYADNTFRPVNTVSRQAAVTFLYRLVASPPGPYPPTGFSDVPGDSPFRIPIEWAADGGVVGGYSDGTFRPTVAVSRQAAVSFLNRTSAFL